MPIELIDEERRAFGGALRALVEGRVPFVVGGAFAVHHYTGLWRNTKDLDLHLRPAHVRRALDLLGRAGYATHVEEAHWLAKAFCHGCLVDLISGSGNFLEAVADDAFRRAPRAELLGVPVRMAPLEELIVTKAYVASRERFDGADVAHLLRAAGPALDWGRLVERFGPHWELLLSLLAFFRFVYPRERALVPRAVLAELTARLFDPAAADGDGLAFRGPLVDRFAYLVDVREWGLPDPRLALAGRRGLQPEAARRRASEDERLLREGKVHGYAPDPSIREQEARVDHARRDPGVAVAGAAPGSPLGAAGDLPDAPAQG